MEWMNRLEKHMKKFSIPELMKYICLGMLGVFILDMVPNLRSASQFLMFDREAILHGEIWRLVSFVFLPPDNSIIFILISLYFYYFLGNALENNWGSGSFCLYYYLGILGTIIGGFITGYATNEYLNLSLLLAFAMIYPEMEFNLFFILPVRVKWIALVDAAYLLYCCFQFPYWQFHVSLLFSLLPFIIFFGKQLFLLCRLKWRHVLAWFRRR